MKERGFKQAPLIFFKKCYYKCNKTQKSSPIGVFLNIMNPLPRIFGKTSLQTNPPLDFQPLCIFVLRRQKQKDYSTNVFFISTTLMASLHFPKTKTLFYQNISLTSFAISLHLCLWTKKLMYSPKNYWPIDFLLEIMMTKK